MRRPEYCHEADVAGLAQKTAPVVAKKFVPTATPGPVEIALKARACKTQHEGDLMWDIVHVCLQAWDNTDRATFYRVLARGE